ncbi:MAG: transcriptional repressor [Spirochaetaceae bacterium]|nr:MAG: transcriptional repressor [Spirochaetaceae bacterium]
MTGPKRDIPGLLKAHGITCSNPRVVITSVLFELERHIDAAELHHAVNHRFPGIGRATIYRTLQLLRDRGLVAEREFGDGLRRYEFRRASHHDHLVCLLCGRVLEFEEASIEALQEQVASRHGFEVLRHRLELYGHCRNCRENGQGAADQLGTDDSTAAHHMGESRE